MENASKALIIAGSVLIAIIIISLGVMVFRNMSGSVQNEASLDKQKIASFNGRITPYVGENISGSQVNALIQLVRSIDQKALSEGDTVQRVSIYRGKKESASDSQKLELKDTDTAIKGSLSRVEIGSYYKVQETYGNSGLITELTITE